jgi:hypothetical protein
VVSYMFQWGGVLGVAAAARLLTTNTCSSTIGARAVGSRHNAQHGFGEFRAADAEVGKVGVFVVVAHRRTVEA